MTDVTAFFATPPPLAALPTAIAIAGGLLARLARSMSKFSTVAAVSMLAAAVLVGCTKPDMKPGQDEARLATLSAQGVQIYECRMGTRGGPAWGFVAPEAELFDAHGRRVGSHGAGPYWRHEDGSGFFGTVRGRMEAPVPSAIPWLLMTAWTEHPDEPDGAFAGVSSVKRMNTVGGQPPRSGCDKASIGKRVHIAYRADYVLYGRKLTLAAR